MTKKVNLKTSLCNKLVEEGRVKEGDVIRHSYSKNRLENGDKNMGRIENHEGLSPTLDTRCDCLGVVVNEKNTKKYKNYITWKNNKGEFNTECNRASLENGLALTVTTNDQCKVAISEGGDYKLKIRKLTPVECFKLMGFERKDYEASRSFSDAALYHVAGDSIVTTVLVAIIGSMTDINFDKVIDDYVEKLSAE